MRLLRPRRAPAGSRSVRPRTRFLRRGLPWLAVTAFAAAVSILFAYHVSLRPLGLHSRSVVFATAEAQVLVDNQPSAVTYDGSNFYVEKEHEEYNPRQAVYLAQYLESQGPGEAMARAAGIPGRVVSSTGPFTVILNIASLDSAATGPQVGPVPGTDKAYRLLVDVDGVRPMISLYGQAPTVAAARAIVAQARAQLTAEVALQERSANLPPVKRTVIRPLGSIDSDVVDPGAKTTLLATVFAIVFLLGGILVLALRRRAWWRRFPVWIREAAASERHGGPIDDNLDVWPHTRRFLPWTMAAFMVLLFLVPIDALLGSGAGPGSAPIAPTLDRVLLTVTAIGWLVKVRSWRRIPVRLGRLHVVVTLFVAICFLSVALNGFELAVLQEVMPTVKKIVLVMSFVAFFFLASDIIRPGEVRPFIKLVIALGVVCALGTAFERSTRTNLFYNVWNGVLPMTRPPEMDVLDDIGRLGVVGPTSQPLELATLLSLVLPFSTIFALEAKDRWARVWYITATAIIMAGAIATSRKTSVVAPVVGLVVLMAYRPRSILKAMLIAALPLFVCVHLLAPGQIGSVFDELLPSQAASVNTDKSRVERYDAVRPDIMSHFVLGRGFGDYDPIKYRYLDNQYLGLLIETGVLGMVVFLGIFAAAFSLSHPLIRGPDRSRSGIALALQASLAMIMVASALFDTMSFSHVSYMLFFLLALLVAIRKPVRPLSVVRTVATPAAVRPAPSRARQRESENELQPA